MSASLTYLLIAAGLIVILILSLVIRRQLLAQKHAREQEQQQRETLERDAREHRQYLIDSVRIIAAAVLHDDKMTMTEGCIRLKVLLDNLAPHLHQHEQFAVINRVFEATSHIPFLEQWRALSSAEKRRYEKEMAQVEKEQGEHVRHAMQALQTYPLEQMQ
ncbi:hypothetical protein GCM10011352_33010 [Marinobacterium zhoushanense]|uniref:DUF2489 domain-containing protein n=1 Tax=Marinobacterium zhoushanense TaxID=1679163 RepID=A0ABQ1KQY0_9GAMM|nr:DUF2489 domain-containing protein [Marinobacterium zhoushanense]GGC04186.1 hypothetical protein GCM10011352_33010 [Marinobacterium zhoushanense]